MPRTDVMDRLPYGASSLSILYEGIDRLPVSVLLVNLRSLHNVGAFFRTADAARIERLYLAGITGAPPRREIAKTALGAESSVSWERADDPAALVERLRARGCEIAGIETSPRARDLFDWQARFPVCLLFGHEVAGLDADLLERCDTHVRIPTLGAKHSLNVATAGGVVIYELLRQYRRLIEARSAADEPRGVMREIDGVSSSGSDDPPRSGSSTPDPAPRRADERGERSR